MTAGLEQMAAHAWLEDVLGRDALLRAMVGDRIFDGVASEGSASPWLVYRSMSTVDIRGVGAVRVGINSLWLVKGVSISTTYELLRPIAKQIDDLLHDKSGVVADGNVFACVRDAAFEMPEVSGGREYRHLGGMYRIIVQ